MVHAFLQWNAYVMTHIIIITRHPRYPLRAILPGYVGGRMVKWLHKIELSDRESPSWYHWYGM